MSSTWPDIEDPTLTPPQKMVVRDAYLRKLRDKVEHLPGLEADDKAVIAVALQFMRGMRWLWRTGKVLLPIAAMLLFILGGWDKTVGGWEKLLLIVKAVVGGSK